MPVRFDNTIASQVQQANDIVDVISEHVSLSRRGKEMVGLCPFHDDHRPSMYVNSAKQIFKCFACSAGGDVLKFVQMRENLTFPQAIERLAERVGIKLQPVKATRGQSQERTADLDPNKLAKVNAWAAEHFRKNLYNEQTGAQARKYIITERQITPESMKKWQLGLAINSQDDLTRAAKAKGIPEKLLEQAGLVFLHNESGRLFDKFVNRLMFPISDVTGRIIGFGGRTLDGNGAKYINSPTTVLFDKSSSLYGLDQARHKIASTGTAVVVEGYTDCIMAHSKGCENVVATLGTSFTSGHGRILRRYAKKVVLIFDSDNAGIEAADRALEVCLSQRIDTKLACVPEGKDPCDFILAAGKERFEKLVDGAADVFQFKWNRLTENFGNDETLVGRKRAVEEFLQTIATAVWSGHMAAIDRGLIANRLSGITGVSTKEINAELNRRITRAQKAASYPAAVTAKNQPSAPVRQHGEEVLTADLGQGRFALAQREVLEVLLNEPKLFDSVKQKITADIFDVPILRQIAAILIKTLLDKADIHLREILARTESIETGNIIMELAHAGEKKGNFQSRLTGAVDAIQRCQAERKKSEIKAIEDPRQFLQRVCESTGKKNPHNLGMT